MSCIIRKPTFCICENKISSSLPFSVTVQASLCPTKSEDESSHVATHTDLIICNKYPQHINSIIQPHLDISLQLNNIYIHVYKKNKNISVII